MHTLPGGRRVSALLPNQFFCQPVGELGRGGLGRVDAIRILESRATHLPVGSHWARKRLSERWLAWPEARARFDREIVAISAMDHPGIVRCTGHNLEGQERFYIMPLYDGSLRRLIAAHPRGAPAKVVAAHGAQLARALAYAHSLGFIHRDIKPDNVLYQSGGPLVLTDWGLGYFIHRHSVVLTQLTRGGMGTEYYCSPEQWTTGKCDARGDVFSLGITLDEWYWGRQQLGGPAARPKVGPDAEGQHLAALLIQMTAPSAYARPSSMAAVVEALEGIAR